MIDPVALLRDGHRAPAMEALLHRWRQAPSAALARTIERIDALEPLVPLGRSAIAEARKTSRLGVPRLPEIVHLHLPELQQKAVTAILTAQRALPSDPRWTPQLLAWLDAPPFLSGREFWSAAFALIEHSGDPRFAARMARGLASMPHEVRAFIGVGTWARAQEASEAVVDAGAPPVVADIEPVLAALEARHTARGAQRVELFERLLHDRGDRDALLVYGDLLLQDGDPQGEFIALSLQDDKASRARRKALQKEHGLGWMGRLAPYAQSSRLLFRDGLPWSARIAFKRRSQAVSVLDAPEWRLLRELDLDVTVSWSHQDGPAPWRPILEAAQNVQIARWADNMHVLHEILASNNDSVREIHGRTDGHVPAWDPTRLQDVAIRPRYLDRLVLPHDAVPAVLHAVKHGVTIDRLEFCQRPTPTYAEYLKYGYARAPPSRALATRVLQRTKNHARSVRVEIGWFNAVEAVLET